MKKIFLSIVLVLMLPIVVSAKELVKVYIFAQEDVLIAKHKLNI